MKYVVTGGAGRLGSYLCKKIDCVAPSKAELDVLNLKQIEKHVSPDSIDAILHLAAICDVPTIERNKEETYLLNVQGTRNISNAGARLNKKI